MKRIFLSMVIAALFVGCATPQQPNLYELKKRENQVTISQIKQIEIVYHEDEEYAVINESATADTSHMAQFGVLGLIFADGFKALSGSRAADQTKIYTAAIKKEFQDQSINFELAKKLQELIVKSGRNVKLTKVARPTGLLSHVADKPSTFAVKDFKPAEGYTQLILRNTIGYAAGTDLMSFRSLARTEFSLQNYGSAVLLERRIEKRGTGDTYSTFGPLLEARQKSFPILLSDAVSNSDVVMQAIFEPLSAVAK
jgi:hypothetical protein